MKRVLMGVVWFVVFFVGFYIIFGIILGIVIAHTTGVTHPESFQQSMQTGRAFAQAHDGALAVWRLIILVGSIVLAVAGTLKGVLPGTRKPKAGATLP